ncbi:hypothetical protein yc1106_08494 [Curvularia clavata]|uniref:C2H2-type domain-containing protein n=1 Tax=Curvularia clavata TaxID=95742 RepID=A0A9Q9DWQ8_CURCL|nr:hypothetical protein yc1106_08494 [Curvularia clavata]
MAAQLTTFQRVLEEFKLSLSEEEKRQFTVTTLDDLHMAIETIQRKQQSDKRLRAMSKLELFLEGMKEYDKVVSVFLNTGPILAFVWALWKNFDTEFAAILRNLHAHMELIKSQASVAQFSEILRLRRHIEKELDQQSKDEVYKRRMVVYQWLAAANCRADQEAYAKVRQEFPGSGHWLLQERQFSSWFEPDLCSAHLLWMTGIPGAVEQIEEVGKLQDVQVAFFYCRYLDSARNTFLAVARGILSQLLFKDASLLSYLYEKLSTSGQVTLSLESTARELLEISLKAFEKLYIVIDGLDECEREQRQQIVSFFKDTWESVPSADKDSLRCMFISQDDDISRKDFAAMSSIKITESHTRKDITHFVAARSMIIKQKFDLTEDRKQWIQDQVTKSADGMFLFAHLMTSYLIDQDSRAELDKELLPENFPQGGTRLEAIYLLDKSLVSLESGEGTLALLCISYLCFEGFDVEDDSLNISGYIPSGYYGFVDYAYAYWARHLDAFLRVQESEDATKEISEAAEVFIDMYWTQPKTKTVPPKTFSARWQALSNNRNFDKLVVAGHLAQRQLLASTAHLPDAQALKLHDALLKVRERLEPAIRSAPSKGRLASIGFKTKQERDDHIKKHERSFFCSFSGCAMATIGCGTLKELHKHETMYHGTFEYDDDEAEYPELPSSYDCNDCDAKFTRNHNLQIHMRSRHAESGNKPAFVCAICSKSFTRKGALTRHETTAHKDAKKFICEGELNDGSHWGCGRVFKRGDMLSRHWKSAKGQKCLAQKQNEEDADNLSSSGSVQPSIASPTPT